MIHIRLTTVSILSSYYSYFNFENPHKITANISVPASAASGAIQIMSVPNNTGIQKKWNKTIIGFIPL